MSYVIGFEQTDENEFTLKLANLTVETPFGSHTVDGVAHLTQHEAVELWRKLDETIGAHVREGERARVEPRPIENHLATGAYALDDPRHPTYADRMAEAGDLARKAQKENR